MGALTNQALSPYEFSLLVMNGPEKGTIYKLIHGELIIGRDSSCDIVIKKDDKASRQHVKIKIANDLVYIKNLTKKNILIVNSEEIDEAYLDDKCLITIGRTQYKLNIVKKGQIALHNNVNLSPVRANKNSKNKDNYNNISNSVPTKKQDSNSGLYIIVAIVVLLFIWLLTDSDKKPQPKSSLTIDESIKTLDKEIAEINDSKLKSNTLTQQARIAKSFFVKGFRDYKQGQYFQSMSSFQACLSHVPSHQVCRRYYSLAKKKFDEILQYQMNLGRQYYSQGQYDSCISIFRNIMYSIRDAKSKAFIEAKKLCQLCELKSEGRLICRPN